MKKFIMTLALVATTAFAEPSFNQVQDLIGRQQYAAAEQGLEQIIKNHPNSAKAYYSMAQAQAGLGNLDKARYALDKATGLDPTLGFASSSQVQSLREAIAPQVKKIEVVEESHWFRNTLIVILLAGIGYAVYAYIKRRREDEKDGEKVSTPITPLDPSPSDKAYMKDHNLIDPIKPVAEKKVEVPPRGKETTVKYAQPIQQPVYSAPPVQPTHTTTVVNQSNDGLLTGMLIGNMLSHHDHHDRVIEREVVREVPSKSYESSNSRSSSWDSDTTSSSWDSDSSSSRSSSSSWDSDSSSSSSWSSSSSSDSSWDSSSSSSDSSW